MKSKKVLLGILAGVAAGATIGVLFANGKISLPAKKSLERGKHMQGINNNDSINLLMKSKMMLTRLMTRPPQIIDAEK